MNHPTTKQLQALKGVTWSDEYRGPISEANILFWAALEELASTTELFIPIEQIAEIAPTTVQVLEGGRDYFEALGAPRPHAVELILLKLARLNAGLDPDGE